MSTSTTSRRVVDSAEFSGRFHLPEQWLRALVAGVEAAVLSWLVVTVPAIATYIATASAPELGSAHWIQAARVGSAAWLLGNGGALTLDTVSVSLIPLGVTAICLLLVSASVRRARLGTWPTALFSMLGYALMSTAYVAFADMPGLSRGVAGALVVSSLGAWWGMRRVVAPRWWRAAKARTPRWARDAVSLWLRILLVFWLIATLATIAALAIHFGQVRDLHDQLGAGVVSAVVLVAAQLLLLPTVIVWTGAFLVGPGFAVGTGTVFAPGQVSAGPLPVIPILGGLPQPGGALAHWSVLGFAGVVVGIIAGAWLIRSMRERSAGEVAASVILGAILAGAVMALLAVASSGSVGPGRMGQVGPSPIAAGASLCWQVGLGAGVILFAAHPIAARGGRAIRSGASVWWQQVRGGTNDGDRAGGRGSDG